MSLMNIRKSKGPRILLCGTHDITGSELDMALFIRTHCVRLSRYPLNQFHKFPVMPKHHSFTSSSLWGTLSNAFLKSKYTTSMGEDGLMKLLRNRSSCCWDE